MFTAVRLLSLVCDSIMTLQQTLISEHLVAFVTWNGYNANMLLSVGLQYEEETKNKLTSITNTKISNFSSIQTLFSRPRVYVSLGHSKSKLSNYFDELSVEAGAINRADFFKKNTIFFRRIQRLQICKIPRRYRHFKNNR